MNHGSLCVDGVYTLYFFFCVYACTQIVRIHVCEIVKMPTMALDKYLFISNIFKDCIFVCAKKASLHAQTPQQYLIMSNEPTSNMDEKVRRMAVIAEVVVRHQYVVISLGVFYCCCLFLTLSQFRPYFGLYRMLTKPAHVISLNISLVSQLPCHIASGVDDVTTSGWN